jgi:hypothetical protein
LKTQLSLASITYNTLPPFFVKYLRLQWSTHPELQAIEDAPSSFMVHFFCSMQGQKDPVQKFYQLMYKYLRHIGLLRSISNHDVFVWKQEASGLFLALATYALLVLCDDQSQFPAFKSHMEAMLEITRREGAIIRFLNMRITESPAGIITHQTDHIVEIIVECYFKD